MSKHLNSDELNMHFVSKIVAYKTRIEHLQDVVRQQQEMVKQAAIFERKSVLLNDLLVSQHSHYKALLEDRDETIGRLAEQLEAANELIKHMAARL